MRVVLDDVVDTARPPKLGASGVTNAVAADAKRANIAAKDKRAIFPTFWGCGSCILLVWEEKRFALLCTHKHSVILLVLCYTLLKIFSERGTSTCTVSIYSVLMPRDVRTCFSNMFVLTPL